MSILDPVFFLFFLYRNYIYPKHAKSFLVNFFIFKRGFGIFIKKFLIIL